MVTNPNTKMGQLEAEEKNFFEDKIEEIKKMPRRGPRGAYDAEKITGWDIITLWINSKGL